MKNEHLTDFEIQEYLFNDLNTNQEIADHIQHCDVCRMIAEEYKTLTEAVKAQEKPVIDADLADLVMNSLPVKKHDFSFGKLMISVLAPIFIPVIIILIFMFRTVLSAVLKGISPLFICLIVTTVISLSVVQFLDAYIHYRKHMDILNSY